MARLRSARVGGSAQEHRSLDQEFRAVRRYFDAECSKVWQKGLDWLAAHSSFFGVLSWEPFFVGLLKEEEAFAGRSISALLNRTRLINRLRKVRYDGDHNTFGFDEIRGEIDDAVDEYEGYDFWTRILVEGKTNKLELSSEGTLKRVVEYIESGPRGDWATDGRRYLDHPGELDSGGLLQDAIIGEVVGSDLAFAELLKGLLAQQQLDVSVAIAWRHGRLVVLPHSKLESFSVGRMTSGVLSAVEAQFVNQVRLVEETDFEAFEDLINSRLLSEGEIHRFFECHPAFLCLESYVSVKSHPVLMFEEDRRRVPDFFLERMDSGLSDILELKLPSSRIAFGPEGRRVLSSAVFRGIAQLREYARYFEAEGRKRAFEQETGIRLYRPNLMLVIGRDRDFRSAEDKRTLADDLPRGVSILTYDDVLAHAKGRRLYVDRVLARKVARHGK